MRTKTCIKPGDYNALDIILVNENGEEFDISSLLKTVHFYQDILSPYWSGQISVFDNANIITTLPIEVGMKLKLNWATDFVKPGFATNLEFVVYAISNRHFINRTLSTYTLHFATPDFILDKNIRISGKIPSTTSESNYDKKSVPPEKPEILIEKLITEYLGKGDDTTYLVKYDKNLSKFPYSINANNWSLYYTISFLTKLAIHELESTKEDAADYLFFRIGQNTFAFHSYNNLYNKEEFETTKTFKQIAGNLDHEDELYSILDFKMKHFDAAKSLSSGEMGNQIISFDFANLNVKFNNSEFKESENKLKSTKQFITDASNANIIFKPVHLSASTGHISEHQTKWLADRKRRLLLLEKDKLIIQVHGQSEAINWIGKTVQLVFPSLNYKDEFDEDPLYSGKYLISAIRHSITPERYFMNLALVKIDLEK